MLKEVASIVLPDLLSGRYKTRWLPLLFLSIPALPYIARKEWSVI